MDHITTAKEILDTMLGYLGFVVRIEEEPSKTGLALQVFTEESEQLIGKNGERLDDIQYLLNRLLHQRDSDAPRVRVDVQHFRSMKEDAFLEGVREQAERVRHSGRPVKFLFPAPGPQRLRRRSGDRIIEPPGFGQSEADHTSETPQRLFG